MSDFCAVCGIDSVSHNNHDNKPSHDFLSPKTADKTNQILESILVELKQIKMHLYTGQFRIKT